MNRWITGAFVLVLMVGALSACGGGGGGVETSGDESIYLKAEQGDATAVGSAIRAGFDVNKQDEYGMTLLHHAVGANQVGVVETLINDFRADKTIQDNDGRTPVDLAQGNPDMLDVLQ